jgi:exopolyphosphatase/guanosine-5'-triphosphate,3'-diphosphate pyrophosphatase
VIHVTKENGSLQIKLICSAEPLLEMHGLEEAAKDLEEAWDVKLTYSTLLASKE